MVRSLKGRCFDRAQNFQPKSNPSESFPEPGGADTWIPGRKENGQPHFIMDL